MMLCRRISWRRGTGRSEETLCGTLTEPLVIREGKELVDSAVIRCVAMTFTLLFSPNTHSSSTHTPLHSA